MFHRYGKKSMIGQNRSLLCSVVLFLILNSFRFINMELNTAIALIEKGVSKNTEKEVWADLGAGHGLFTRALATLLPMGSTLLAVDKDAKSLRTIEISDDIILEKIQLDFNTEILDTEQLNGILMANFLHYINDKKSFLLGIKKKLKAYGRIILVEYERDKANPWVPYPINYISLQKLSEDCGFGSIHKIGEVPSRYQQGTIYSALLTSSAI